MAPLWYVLRSKARKEETLWRQASRRGLDVYFPRIKVNPVNPRARRLRPYFPGYMFVRADLDQVGRSTLDYMPYAIGLVDFGGEPATTPEAFILALKRRLQEIWQSGGELFDGLQPGDPVLIREGPFTGYEALFDIRLSGTDRVRVLLKMLSDRHLPVELRAGWIERSRAGAAASGER
jgi:transcription antitermination factor NusG